MRFFSSVLLIALFAFGCTDQAAETANDATTPAMAEQDAPAVEDGAAMMPAKLNLNLASGDDFKAIPGMTDRMVHEFEEYRPYASIQQFRREIGKYVSEDVVAEYEKYVFVPVDPNNCDAPTLMQLPGVDASVADELIASRPFASRDAFLEALAPMVEPGQLDGAGAFLVQE